MSTGFENERQNIEEEFVAGWTSATTPIKFENVNGLVSGTDMLKDDKGLTQWCRITILNAASSNMVIGGTTVRHAGDIIVNVWVKSGTGTDTARELCDDVYDIFNNANFDGIQCHSSYVTTEGDVEGWFQMTVSTPYTRDQ